MVKDFIDNHMMSSENRRLVYPLETPEVLSTGKQTISRRQQTALLTNYGKGPNGSEPSFREHEGSNGTRLPEHNFVTGLSFIQLPKVI